MNTGMLNRVRKMYDTVGLSINTLRGAVKNKEGQDYLSFLSNSIEASSLYLQAFELGTGIQQIKKDSVGFYTIREKEKAVSICNQALMKYDQYMVIHARMIPDRGTEGTMISLWHGPVYGLKVLRKNIGCVEMDAPVKTAKSTDAPPLPILMEK